MSAPPAAVDPGSNGTKKKRSVVKPISFNKSPPTPTPTATPPPVGRQGWTDSGSYLVEGIGKIGKECVVPAAPATPTQPPAATPERHRREIMPDDLIEERVLGKGASGIVLLVRHAQRNRYYAVKIINIAGAADCKMIAQEISTLDNTSKFLVKAYTAYIRNKRLHIVQEFMDKGSLYDVLRCQHGGIPEPIFARICFQIIKGLEHLHGTDGKCAQRRLHRDLKPANILVRSNGEVKISDFGIATTSTTKGHSTFVGTTTYMSPERIRGDRYGLASDIWSAGLVFCECILGYYPFKNRETFLKLLVEITKAQSIEYPPHITAECKNFVNSCLQQEPELRPTATQLSAHPFLGMYPDVTLEHVAQWLAQIDITPEQESPSAEGSVQGTEVGGELPTR